MHITKREKKASNWNIYFHHYYFNSIRNITRLIFLLYLFYKAHGAKIHNTIFFLFFYLTSFYYSDMVIVIVTWRKKYSFIELKFENNSILHVNHAGLVHRRSFLNSKNFIIIVQYEMAAFFFFFILLLFSSVSYSFDKMWIRDLPVNKVLTGEDFDEFPIHVKYYKFSNNGFEIYFFSSF